MNKHSGILSAYGLSLADIVVERQEPCSGSDIGLSLQGALAKLDRLQEIAVGELLSQGFARDKITFTRYLNCRYQGTDTAIMTSVDGSTSSYEDVFISNYKREYGFELSERSILVDDVRIRAVGNGKPVVRSAIADGNPGVAATPTEFVSVFFERGGRQTVPVYPMDLLMGGESIAGPAIIIQNVATVVIEPGCRANITMMGDIEVIIEDVSNKVIDPTEADPIYLSIFSHRFMGIAEQMGRTLQRTSISVNIKERLDFSCALFDPDGGLVANAPHLPVHLGAMSEAVRYQVRYWGDSLKEGDVLVSNHPQLAGGSHLPDITVITPIFDGGKIVFFVASRGHHADVGGIAPG